MTTVRRWSLNIALHLSLLLLLLASNADNPSEVASKLYNPSGVDVFYSTRHVDEAWHHLMKSEDTAKFKQIAVCNFDFLLASVSVLHASGLSISFYAWIKYKLQLRSNRNGKWLSAFCLFWPVIESFDSFCIVFCYEIHFGLRVLAKCCESCCNIGSRWMRQSSSTRSPNVTK